MEPKDPVFEVHISRLSRFGLADERSRFIQAGEFSGTRSFDHSSVLPAEALSDIVPLPRRDPGHNGQDNQRGHDRVFTFDSTEATHDTGDSCLVVGTSARRCTCHSRYMFGRKSGLRDSLRSPHEVSAQLLQEARQAR